MGGDGEAEYGRLGRVERNPISAPIVAAVADVVVLAPEHIRIFPAPNYSMWILDVGDGRAFRGLIGRGHPP